MHQLLQGRLKEGSVPGLERVLEFAALVGHPEQKVPYIHVAGTNGKGSTCAMLESILRKAGYKTGLFSSPFLITEREYFVINGEIISECSFVERVNTLLKIADQMKDPPTEFEFYTVMAMQYFAEEQCDIVIMEAGMGGRLDATNILPNPVISVITRLGFDHMQYLGCSLKEIAAEKAGIIKENGCVVCYPSEENGQSVIRETAITKHALLYTAEDSDEEIHGYSLSLEGAYQRRNARVVLTAITCLRNMGYTISEESVRIGLSKVRIPARFEVLSRKPLIIADGGHNPQCIRALIDSVKPLVFGRRVFVVTCVMKDKDYPEMYRYLSEIASEFIAVPLLMERALPIEMLTECLLKMGRPVFAAESVADGITKAMKLAAASDCILITGTLYMMGEVRKKFI